MNTNKRMTQEWTRFVPGWSTGILQLLPTQDGAIQVDTPTTPPPAQVHRHRPFFDDPRVKTGKHLAILYTAIIHKSKSTSKHIIVDKTKSLLHKHKKGNINVSKRKSEHDNIKMNKTLRLNVKNNDYVKHKLLRRNVPFKNQVEPFPNATVIGVIKRKHFAKKSKSRTTKHECNVKFLKLLHKPVKLHLNLKFNKSKLIMDFLHAKSNMRLIILHVKGVIITLDNNTMKINATAS